jgi:hypothetical protein
MSHSMVTQSSPQLMATLSMEVSYSFHSQLIGRSGNCISQLMEQTGTRIHLPDRNRIAGQTKSNIVIVRGTLAAVENARQRIRVRHLMLRFVVNELSVDFIFFVFFKFERRPSPSSS